MKKLYLIVTLAACLLLVTSVYSQVSFLGNAYPGGVKYVGWDATSNYQLDIAQLNSTNPYPINFWTSGNHHATLDINGNFTLGLFNANNFFGINNLPVLWHNGNPQDIFVGVGAGYAAVVTTYPALTVTSFTNYNTMAGYGAGNANTTGFANVCVGAGAGNVNTTSPFNTLAGYRAGFNNTVEGSTFYGAFAGQANQTGKHNTFIGFNAGYSNKVNDWNTFVGYLCGYTNGLTASNERGRLNSFFGKEAGYYNDDGSNNTFLGQHSGYTNASGDENVFAGAYSGFWNLASNNCFMGFNTGYFHYSGTNNIYIGSHAQDFGAITDFDNKLNNSIVIGALAKVPHDNQMILGDNSIKVGIGLSGSATYDSNDGPQEKLEINAINTPYPSYDYNCGTPACNPDGGSGWSGLRFRDLTSLSTPVPAGVTGSNVLGVDINGNVVLTQDISSGAPACQNATSYTGSAVEWGGSGSPLLHNTEVQMATATSEYNVYFSGQSVLGGLTTPVDVGIGWPTTQPLTAKLDVVNFTQTTTMFNYNNKTAGSFYETGSYTIYPPLDEFVGVMGITDVTGSGKRNNLGGDFYARYTANNIGARGTGDDFQASNIGLWGNALNGVNNIGVKSTVTIPSSPSANIGVLSEVGPSFGGFPVGTTIGVYGSVPPNGTGTRAIYGDLGIGLTFPCPTWPCPASPYAPDAAGYFNGDVVATNGVYALSDENLKENIHDIPNAMDILNQLNPKWYSFKQTENASMQLPKGSHYGLLSQDVQQVLPNIVKDCIHPARMDSDGNETYAAINFKAINYTELIPLLIASVKQMDSTNQALQQQISDLQAAQTGHRASPPHDNNSDQGQDQGQAKPNAPIDVTLSSKSIVLDQNQPNPFKEQTTITYFIPDDAMNVKMIFTDSRGNVMKEVSIPEKGNGQLNVYAQDLSSGIYTYTLVADGVTIDSKKMVCNK